MLTNADKNLLAIIFQVHADIQTFISNNDYNAISLFLTAIPAHESCEIAKFLPAKDGAKILSYASIREWLADACEMMDSFNFDAVLGFDLAATAQIIQNFQIDYLRFGFESEVRTLPNLVVSLVDRQAYEVFDNLIVSLCSTRILQETTGLIYKMEFKDKTRWENIGLTDAPSIIELQEIIEETY